VGYIGYREAYPILIKGLKRLEYRGYDSAGVALLNGDIQVFKRRGKVSDLEQFVEASGRSVHASVGIGHTRWATHGEPNDVNAHPHVSETHNFAIIHNGIIENYLTLKERLLKRGHVFQSETDTEVLVHLIEAIYTAGRDKITPDEAVRIALSKAEGAFAIVVLVKSDPAMLIAARRASPLVIGLGHNEYFLASDATPIIEYTKNVVYLSDNDIAVIRNNEMTLKTIENRPRIAEVQTLEMELEAIEKGGYDHFMLKEIFEQPRSIRDSLRGRVREDVMEVRLGGLLPVLPQLTAADKITIIACGTSWHAGLVGEYLFEELARIPVEVEYASEFRYRNPVIRPGDVVIAISQSGETADTLAAVQMAKSQGALVLGICNVVGATIPRETVAGVYTHAGPEIGVASTKAFTTQITALSLLVIALAKNHESDPERERGLVERLIELPALIEKTLTLDPLIHKLALRFVDKHHALFLGRGALHPIAMEGALKLKEISYIHAEAYAAGELKHGPLALVDADMPVIAVAPNNDLLEKLKSNLMEVRARGGELYVFADPDAAMESSDGVHVIHMPRAVSYFQAPVVYTIPLQLLAYHVAILRGTDVDQPRNLAKSVTVE
jgi:glucosamine--fructose-6-phosphate aminotransferase (isomerizing)